MVTLLGEGSVVGGRHERAFRRCGREVDGKRRVRHNGQSPWGRAGTKYGGPVMPGVDAAAGTLAVPTWLAGAAVAVFVVDILLAAERAGGVALITSLFRVGLIAAAVLGAWLYVQLGDVTAKGPNPDSERRALDDRKRALMAGSIAPGSALSCLDKLAGEAVESACEKALFASPESVASAVKYVVAQIELLNDGTAYAGRGDAGYAAEFTPLRTAIEFDRFGLVAHVLRDREGCTVKHCDALARLRDSTRVLANLRDHTFEQRVKKYTAIWNAPRPAEGVVAAAGPSVALLEANGPGTLASLPREPAAAESASQSAAVAPPATLASVTSLQQEQPPLRDSATGAVSQERAPDATSHGAGPLRSGSPEGNAAASPSGPSDETLSAAAPDVSETPVVSSAPVDEVKAYLWSVYQRSPAKADGHGDFTWKDVSAAGRAGLSVEDYVIGGIDPDFRELLFAAGHAMDAAGVGWTILSGFRDDFRQNLAAGLKARVNNSFHGGSEATGGYGHGCAVDLASVDRLSDDKVWSWVDRKGHEFDLNRPLRAADPAHTLPMAGWHEAAATLRNKRLGTSAEADPEPLGKLVTLEQYLCIRPFPPENAAAGAQVADRHTTANWAATHVSRHDTKGNGAPHKPNSVRDNETKQSAATMPAASKR
jgi:hypothetical protein